MSAFIKSTNFIARKTGMSGKTVRIAGMVLVVAAIVVAVWAVWRKFRKNGNITLKTDQDIQNATGTAITQSLDFAHLAKRMWDATVSYHTIPWYITLWPTGTNESEVYAVLESINTQADYMKLEKAWVSYFESQSWVIRNLSIQAYSTLPAVLKSELTKKELTKARNILIEKGITPDF